MILTRGRRALLASQNEMSNLCKKEDFTPLNQLPTRMCLIDDNGTKIYIQTDLNEHSNKSREYQRPKQLSSSLKVSHAYATENED